ncbi:MAG: glycosyltransferase [Candidatus Omnitrophica bacterium]|nr:glycosyltransferase [Candidatus Omnitrophota bacterium]
MNILYLIVSLRYGGAERQFCELVKGISKRNGIRPYVYYLEKSNAGYDKVLESAGIQPVHLPRKTKFDFSLVYRLSWIIKALDIDIVHSFMSMSGLIACLSARLCNTPVVCSSIRDATVDTSFKTMISLRVQAVLSNILVANSHAGLKSRFKSLKPKYRVVYNGIDRDRFHPDRHEIERMKKRFQLERFDKVVAMIASLSVHKDHNTFLESARLVLERYPRTGVLLVGDGPNRARLEQKVVNLGIQRNTIFAGYTEHVIEILSVTHVSVLMTNASIFAEGLSNSLLESMAMSVPVVASKGGGTDEVIDHGVNGYLLDPYDAFGLAEVIMKFLDDDSFGLQMGRSGRSIIKKRFGFAEFLQNYVNLYYEVLKTKGHG